MSTGAIVQSLAYIGVTSPAAERWRAFGPDLLALEPVADGADGSLRFRNDELDWRITIHPGDADDLAYLGWDVGSADGLARATEAIAAAGCEVHGGDVALAAIRGVEDVAWFLDPFGFRHEFTHGPHIGATPFQPGADCVRFVTGEGGLGHAVLIVPDLDAATDFYVGAMGFGHSDDIDMGLFVRFLHCNQRHHTLAFSTVPGMVGFHHLMLEVTDPDVVERAYARARADQVPVAMTLGKHTNDEMFSFYVRTPSGFEIEYGAGGRLIDPDDWETVRFDAMSHWGHEAPSPPLFPGILRPASWTDHT